MVVVTIIGLATALFLPAVAYIITKLVAPPPNPSTFYTPMLGATVVRKSDKDEREGAWRRYLKYIVHVVVRKCELQRLCEGVVLSPEVFWEVEWSLRRSHQLHHLYIKLSNDVEFRPVQAIQDIISIKKLKTTNDVVIANLTRCLEKRYQIAMLCRCVEQWKNMQYDSTNPVHEDTLERLWTTMMPDEPFPGRVGKHWSTLGFQGVDPATDFRSTGMLSLYNMLYFLEKHSTIALSHFNFSKHPKHGYPFALACINMTAVAIQLMQSGALHCHLYGLKGSVIELRDFQDVFCWLIVGFCQIWKKELPENIMAYPRIKKLYEDDILLPALAATLYGNFLLLPNDVKKNFE